MDFATEPLAESTLHRIVQEAEERLKSSSDVEIRRFRGEGVDFPPDERRVEETSDSPEDGRGVPQVLVSGRQQLEDDEVLGCESPDLATADREMDGPTEGDFAVPEAPGPDEIQDVDPRDGVRPEDRQAIDDQAAEDEPLKNDGRLDAGGSEGRGDRLRRRVHHREVGILGLPGFPVRGQEKPTVEGMGDAGPVQRLSGDERRRCGVAEIHELSPR